MKIAITGATGLLGGAISRAFAAEQDEAVALSRNPFDPQARGLDVTSESEVLEVFAEEKFDLCVHCAASPDVNWCEANQNAAWQLNVMGTAHVAEACRRSGTRLIHVSSDYVFDGLRRQSYSEQDERSPVQFYGVTKAKAEEYVEPVPGSLIVRIPLLFGSGPRATWPAEAAAALRQGERFRADEQEIRQPAYTVDVARAIVELAGRPVEGILHLAPESVTTKYDWGRAIATLMGADPALILPTASPAKIARPPHSVLDTARMREIGITPLRPFTEASEQFLRVEGFL